MAIEFIDSHCHLDFECFAQDLPAVLDQAHELGVRKFIIPGTQHATWQTLIDLHAKHPQCHYALGLHPYFIREPSKENLDDLASFIETHKPVAIGEIGLDFSHPHFQPSHQKVQTELFIAQLKLAKTAQLPVILHARKTYDQLLKEIRKLAFNHGGVIHAFTGSLQQAEQFIEYGFKLGIGGSITYPRGERLRGILKQLPLHALVLETDSPDMPLHGFQGQRNTPSHIPSIAGVLSETLQLPLDAIAEQTTKNTVEIFKLTI